APAAGNDLFPQHRQRVRPRDVSDGSEVPATWKGLYDALRQRDLFRDITMADHDARANPREALSHRGADAAGSADNKHGLIGHRFSTHLRYSIGGFGRMASPGSITKRCVSVYQGARTPSAGGTPSSCRR